MNARIIYAILVSIFLYGCLFYYAGKGIVDAYKTGGIKNIFLSIGTVIWIFILIVAMFFGAYIFVHILFG